jgi:hypothetical protein
LRFPGDIESAGRRDHDVTASIRLHAEDQPNSRLGGPGERAGFPGSAGGHLADLKVFINADDPRITGVLVQFRAFVKVMQQS